MSPSAGRWGPAGHSSRALCTVQVRGSGSDHPPPNDLPRGTASQPRPVLLSTLQVSSRKVLNGGGRTERRPVQFTTFHLSSLTSDPSLRGPFSRRPSGLILLPPVGLACSYHGPPHVPCCHVTILKPGVGGSISPSQAPQVPRPFGPTSRGPFILYCNRSAPGQLLSSTASGPRRCPDHALRSPRHPTPGCAAPPLPTPLGLTSRGPGRAPLPPLPPPVGRRPLTAAFASQPPGPLGFSIAARTALPGSWTHHSSALQGPQPGAPSPLLTSGPCQAHLSHAASPAHKALSGTQSLTAPSGA
ncbi:hypothetical protein NDU88_002538 [Pleurodeles waltl]|uniref:Uncharacterized protein n=1 Tax=Pleurodeles waltl TaxID=8319 RepID=A0AAV7W347_PLEWA|nr:hypothetical protein NDU88_002538 [Pleurodeles waltl]